ncbi:MAG: nuclear transport factor 2 family protein [Myxococcales bacterium]|nr:nuclear transport factor 2 family protein [Myxococcales bacterium]
MTDFPIPTVDPAILASSLDDDESTAVLATLEAWVAANLNHDLEVFLATTSMTMTTYEWYTQDGRIEGRNLHEDWIREQSPPADVSWTLEDLLLRLYDRVAVASYTLRVQALEHGMVVQAHSDESVVLEQHDEAWRVVHVHKSPHGLDTDV